MIRLFILCSLFVLLGISVVWAQKGTREMLEQRSIPSAQMWQKLDAVSEFSPEQMQALDKRSVYSSAEEKMLGARSEFSEIEYRMLTQRSEFTPQMMQLLESLVAPGTDQARLQRRSRLEAERLRRDKIVDTAMLALFLRRSVMSPAEKERVDRSSNQKTTLEVLHRSSLWMGSQLRILSGRSQATGQFLRLLQNRSVD